MLKIGLALEESDLERFRKHGSFELLLLSPGFPVTKNRSEEVTGVKCSSLSEFVKDGEISSLSRQVAPAVRSLMSRLCSETIEARSSQNDLYQYHLRLQWLYIVALDRFLTMYPNVDLWLVAHPYQKYDSPMRPEEGLLYNNARLLGYLTSKLASCKDMSIGVLDSRNRQLVHVADTVRRNLRKLIIKFFIAAKLCQKIMHAQTRPRILAVKPDSLLSGSIGIIVRTDSEVISASYLIKKLENESVKYIVIHDELISSTTTLERLETLGIQSVSIGAMLGLKGIWQTWRTKVVRLNLKSSAFDLAPLSHCEQILINNEEVLNHLKDRLHDFYALQFNFRLELEQIIERFGIRLLVTYAFVDQWGGVIKAAGDHYGIRTLAIQNAAQDPEEYPKLCWADFYCVESQYLKHRLIAMGYPSEIIAATGLSQFSSVGPQLIEGKDWGNSCRRLLILTQPIYQSYYVALIEACITFSEKHSIDLAIKYHPRQTGNEYDEVIKRSTGSLPVQIYSKEPLDELINKSSAVISVSSTALIRSINLGIPTISFLPVEERYLDLYYTNNSNLYCTSTVEELTALLELMISDESDFRNGFERRRDYYLQEHATYEPTGNPDYNIIHFIKKII